MGRVEVKNMSEADKANDMDKKSIAGSDHCSIDSTSSFLKPSIPPPPYFKTQPINKSSLETAINARLNKSAMSPLRLTVKLLQLAFALASGISYAIELDHRYSASTANFIYAEAVFGLTLLAIIIDSVTIRYYPFIWAVEWILAVMWIACFGVFYDVYLNGEIPADYAVVDFGRMKFAGWCNLVNAVLWLGSALFSSAVRCSGIRAAIKRRQEKKKGREEGVEGIDKIENIKTCTITADHV